MQCSDGSQCTCGCTKNVFMLTWPSAGATQGDLEEQEFQQGIDDARGKKKIRVGRQGRQQQGFHAIGGM